MVVYALSLAVVVALSIAARVVLAGRSSWAVGRGMFAAGAVYVVGFASTGLYLWWPLTGSDAFFLIGGLIVIVPTLWLPLLRCPVAIWLAYPGLWNGLKLWDARSWDAAIFVGSTIYGAFYLGVLMAFAPQVGEYLRSPWREPPAAGHCENCGYNLTGNVSGVCPECGRAIRDQMPQA